MQYGDSKYLTSRWWKGENALHPVAGQVILWERIDAKPPD